MSTAIPHHDGMEEMEADQPTTAEQKQIGELFDGLVGFFEAMQQHVVDLRNMKAGVDSKAIGELLVEHLTIEFLMDQILKDLFAESYCYQKARLRFAQKVMLLPSEGKEYQSLLPGVLALNRIRNKFAHDITYELSDSDLEEMLPGMQTAEAYLAETGVEAPRPIDRVLIFCKMLEVYLIVATPRFESRRAAIYRKFPAFKRVVDNMFGETD